jgi:hypothetical protein
MNGLENLGMIGAKVVSHGHYLAFEMAEVAISGHLFADILQPIAELRPPPEVVIRLKSVIFPGQELAALMRQRKQGITTHRE